MSPLGPLEREEILLRARNVLDDTRYEAFAEEVKAAADLPDVAAFTHLRVALSKYPETREMVSRLASDDREQLRGEWLSKQDWRSLGGNREIGS